MMTIGRASSISRGLTVQVPKGIGLYYQLKLQQGRLRLDMRRSFFKKRVAKHWNRLLREVAPSPSLEVFKRTLDMVLSAMV